MYVLLIALSQGCELYQLLLSCEPRPTCIALTPPRVADGAEAPDCVCEIKSLKIVRSFLKPYVFNVSNIITNYI